MEQLENFTEYCKNFIMDNLPNHEGNSTYMCDLGNNLTHGINIDGSITFDRRLAFEYLQEWIWEAGEYFEYERANFGQNITNPFANPEAYMVCMVIEGIYIILQECDFINDNWDNELELTSENINTIIEEINNVDDDIDLF